MNILETAIPGLLIIEPQVWRDDRGYFFESFSKKKFFDAGITGEFVQDNQSYSQRGALRGLHAQAPPSAQGKLVRVIAGRVIDVAVDIRKTSSTYGQHVSVELSGDNFRMFWIPPGFAHGFVTLEDQTIFTYKVTALYDKSAETGLRWNDPELNINWGIRDSEVILSDKDKVLPGLREFESPF